MNSVTMTRWTRSFYNGLISFVKLMVGLFVLTLLIVTLPITLLLGALADLLIPRSRARQLTYTVGVVGIGFFWLALLWAWAVKGLESVRISSI